MKLAPITTQLGAILLDLVGPAGLAVRPELAPVAAELAPVLSDVAVVLPELPPVLSYAAVVRGFIGLLHLWY
jgi:hypothetical protein